MTQDDPARLAKGLEGLTRRIEAIEARLSRLESDSVTPAGEEESPAPYPGPDVAESSAEPVVGSERAQPGPGLVPLLGRSLLIVGGGFLLRAITKDWAYLPASAGIPLGIAYALFWLGITDRTAGRGMRLAAMFTGVTAGLIAYPLLWETTAELGTLPVTVSALVTTAFTLVALLVAWRRSLRGLAWLTTLGGVTTAIVLGFSTDRLMPFVLGLLLVGWATLGLGYVRGWRVLSWAVAFVLDFVLLLIVGLLLLGSASSAIQGIPPLTLVATLLGLVLIYLGTIAGHALLRGMTIGYMEIFLAFAAFLVGFGGALAVSGHTDLGARPLGVVSALLAAGSYAVSFAFVDRRRERRRNFIVFTTFALLFTVVASGVLLSGPARALALAAVGLATFGLGSRFERATLSLHGALYISAAATQSGLLAAGVGAFAGSARSLDAWTSVTVLATLAVAITCCALPVATHGKTWGGGSRLPKLLVLIVATLGLGGILVSAGTALLPVTGEGVDRGLLAALRTGVLAGSAVLLARAARWSRLWEARWLVPPLLVAIGIKLAAEDLRVGRAWTLFLSLALYGGALILTPRLRRRRRATSSVDPGPPPESR